MRRIVSHSSYPPWISLRVQSRPNAAANNQPSSSQIELYNITREDPSVTKAVLVPEHPVQPEIVRQSVTPRKVEITLKKASPGHKWGKWGNEILPDDHLPSASDVQKPAAVSRAATVSTSTTSTASQAPAPPAILQQQQKPSSSSAAAASDRPPSYPTSSRHGAKDWEKLAADEDEDTKAAEGADVDFFFKQLYKNATPEQQRAMMKSYVESSGTALSTNWDDVKDRTVETKPPEGVEAKKW